MNISNVAALVDAEGKPHFKYIVEGANLFITQQARLLLEKRKVVLFKDSSANKGGVTSSSLEVLAGLSLSSDEYEEHMIFKDGKPSPFYESYVRDIQHAIMENAANEFSCIWREHARLQGAKARTLISDELSSKLNELQEELEDSDLFDDEPSRRGVLRRAVPKTLVEKVGLDTLMTRLPVTYQRALFSSWVSSHFVSAPSSVVCACADGIPDLQVRRERIVGRLLPLCARARCLSVQRHLSQNLSFHEWIRHGLCDQESGV